MLPFSETTHQDCTHQDSLGNELLERSSAEGDLGVLMSECGNMSRGNEQKLEHRKFHKNLCKNFFMVRVMEHWNRLPKGVVLSPSLEIFKTRVMV